MVTALRSLDAGVTPSMGFGAQEELAEFNAEEKDVLQSIGALKSAIIVLSKHHEFLQTMPSEKLINIASMLQWQFHKHKDMLRDIGHRLHFVRLFPGLLDSMY